MWRREKVLRVCATGPVFAMRRVPPTLRASAMAASVALALALSAVPMRGLAAQDTLSSAQTARTSAIRRAQRLVNDGNGAEGRALVDSLLNATEPRSPEEAEVLFWRATLAENWDQAQRDYLRVMLEHERSPFAASAMLRLAQGEAMRGDRDAALRYVDRLLAEAPSAPERMDALALRARLLPTVATTAPAAANTPTSPPLSPTPNVPPVPAPAQTSSTSAPPNSAPSPSAPSGAMVWSVQIAAFPSAAEAAGFAAEIRDRGYDARVDGVVAPFRVRFGRYASRAAAAAAMEAYKQKERGDAFLAQVPR